MTRAFLAPASLTDAWLAAMTALLEPGVDALSPLVISIDQFESSGEPVERPGFRSKLNAALKSRGAPAADTTAHLIFPFSMEAVAAASSRAELYDRYRRVVPRLRRYKENKHGIYFERMMMFPSHDAKEPRNQLEAILSFWHAGTVRKSAFQITTWNPMTDLKREPYSNFPCLQHVAFTPTADGGLNVSAFYATQYLVKRAYGNYLGLCRLGAFMAQEMGLKMRLLTCFVSHAPGEMSKARLRELLTEIDT